MRFSVVDSNNNHVIAQRVVPLKRLSQGFRHLRLRNGQNQPLELSTLFLYTKQTVEQTAPPANFGSGAAFSSSNDITSNLFGTGSGSKVKHKQFKLTIYGLNPEDEEMVDLSNSNIDASVMGNGVQVKVTQETTVQQVIEQVSLYFFSFFYFPVFLGLSISLS